MRKPRAISRPSIVKHITPMKWEFATISCFWRRQVISRCAAARLMAWTTGWATGSSGYSELDKEFVGAFAKAVTKPPLPRCFCSHAKTRKFTCRPRNGRD